MKFTMLENVDIQFVTCIISFMGYLLALGAASFMSGKDYTSLLK